ncbi:MAG: dihydrolipoamide acetyltransferase family protein [Isosphaeraceae bacterium]|nr:dihydrolipoamide acetyltransferase family protein [Isosphaeraceae bacterium]
MPIEVTLAKLSPTMESGQIVRWAVKVGDKVKEGDLLAEVQTDKAVMNMEAFDDGVVAHLDFKEGEDIPLGRRVLVMAKKGEDLQEVAAKAAGGAASTTVPAASNGQSATAPAPAAVAAAAPAAAPADPGGRVRSSPLARKVAAEAGVALAQIPGTGPNGRVVRADVEAHLQKKPAAPAAAAPAVRTFAPGEIKRIPHTPMRKTIAKRMLESKAASPEIHVTVDVRLDKLMAVREALNSQLAPEKIKLSVGDFITKAVALALRKHPGLNASWETDALVIHPDVNVGIAVAMEGGLMVPVIQHADQLGLREIRIATEAVAGAVRSGTLKPAQMMGGTFTISNLGMYGVKQFDAIINQPEVAILAVGAGEKRPVVEGDAIVVGTVMSTTLTADHRAVDGALAAEFMRTLRGFLEEPATMLL